MSQHNEAGSISLTPDAPPLSSSGERDFAALRSMKRQLLQEQRAGWESGRQVPVQDLLARWPADPDNDPDAASLLLEEYWQKRRLGQDSAPEQVAQCFPAQKASLANLSYRHELLRSLGGEKCARSMMLELPSSGDEVFGFHLFRELGRGSFARVFLAEQKALAGRPVVVKVSAIDGDEPQTLAQLQHTNIMPIYSAHEDAAAGLRVVCMPYFGGASLSRVLQALWARKASPTRGKELVDVLHEIGGPPVLAGKLEEETAPPGKGRAAGALTFLEGQSYVRVAAWLIARLAEALQHAHERGILHRDIKPSNILLGADGQPSLLDFNLSQNLANGRAQAAAALGGTVAYMAPEHLRALASRDPALARAVDQRADIYELGMVLYEMLTGRRPFDQSASYSPMPALIEAMAVERGRSVPSLREQRRDVSWTLEGICRKCLAPDPAERYQQAEHVADDLRRYLEDLPLRYAPEPSQVERARKFIRRHPRVTQAGAIVSAAAVLLLAGAGVLTATQAKLKAAHARAYEAEGAEARERKQAFTTGAERARCLVNTTTGDPEQVREGLAVCERTLGLYEILDRYDWQQHAALRRLDVAEQRELAEDVREMLLLLASGKVFVATARASAQLPGDAAAVVAPGGPALTPLNVFGTLLAKQTVAGHQPSRQAFVQTALHEGLTLLERAERMPELAPSSALWHDRAAYLRRLGDTTAAARAEDQARTITAVSARDHYLLATAYGREHRLDDAIAQLKRALQLNPRHYWSLFELGTLEEERGEHTLAYGCFSGCVHLWPEFAWGYFNRARVLREMGRFPEALEEYTACLTHDAKLADAYLNRGQLFLNLLRHNEALADFERAAALGRDQARLHCGRGIALEGLHRPVEADAAFANAWARTAEDSDLLLAYAFAVAHRRPERALDAFNKVLAHEPRNTRALYGYAMLAQQQSRNSEAALLCLNLALQVDPTFVAARCARANVLAYRGECELARQDIDLCVKTEPTGVTLYAAACVYALIADKVGSGAAETFATRRALQLLQEALARGYGQDRAAGDSDLAHIQHHPEFRRLLRQHRDPRSEPRGG